MRKTVTGVIIVLMAMSSPAFACDKLADIPAPRVEELMQVMKDDGVPELKRLLAFEELACASRPAVRKFAVDAALASNNKTLRAQSLSALLMGREQIRVELIEETKGDRVMEDWVRHRGRTIAYRLFQRDESKNCISLNSAYKCPDHYAIVIDGLNVRLVDVGASLTGTFALQPDNSLRGSILVNRATKAVAAKIELMR